MARDISIYIKELLLRHDYVIIPGFGAFIGNYFPARADRKEGLFEPPSRKITFNRHLTGNDGLLIGHISAVLDVGYAQSRDIINEWSAALRKKIMAGRPVTIDHLGTFSLNYEGVIVFEPDLTVNYLLSSYGLTTYHRQPVKEFDVRKRMLEGRLRHPAGQPTVRNLLTRAAVIVPLMVALALVPFNDRLFRSHVDEANLNPLARAELEYNREQIDAERAAATLELPDGERAVATPELPDGERTVVTPELPDGERTVVTPELTDGERTVATPELTLTGGVEAPQARPAEANADKKPATTETIPAEANADKKPATTEIIPQPAEKRAPAVVVEEYRYLIIIGSFQGEENALEMVEKLRNLGYDPEMTGGPDGYMRVSTRSYPTLDKAVADLGKVRKSYPGAWVYKIR